MSRENGYLNGAVEDQRKNHRTERLARGTLRGRPELHEDDGLSKLEPEKVAEMPDEVRARLNGGTTFRSMLFRGMSFRSAIRSFCSASNSWAPNGVS
jgi:hypothetical protein